MKAKFLQKRGRSSIQRSGTPAPRSLPTAFQTACVLLLLLTVSFAHAAKVEDFIPMESLLHVKLQDIDAVYNEIETSERWKKAFGQLSEVPEFEELRQGFFTDARTSWHRTW